LGRDLGRGDNTLKLSAIEQIVQAHGHGRIPRLEDVAEAADTSARSLQRFLKKKNITFTQVVEAIRQKEAKALLSETDLSVAEIARKIGQGDVSNFGRSFRKWTGQSPARWRKKRRSTQSER
jgi:transcriptional regulator GlxA family with amidase domain